MAIRNDPRLYTAGSVEFDTKPHLQLYFSLLQKEQARNDAYDEYIRNLNKNINPAGLRNQERAVFEDKLKKWQEMGIKNKELLRNPRKDKGQASMEFQAGYQDLLNTINESKAEEEKKKPLVEIMTDPAKRDRLNEEEVFPKIQQHDQPIFVQDPKTGQWVRDPNRKSFNVADLNFNPKPFEQDKYFKQFEDIKKTDLPPVITKDPKNMTQTEVKTSVYTPEDKDIIATRAVTDYMQNKSFKDLIDKLPPEDYNDFYKENFGHDIQTPADLAAAYTLKGLQQKAVTTAIKDDVFARQKAMEAIRNANARGLIRLRDQLGDEDKAVNDLWIDEYVNTISTEAKKPENTIEYKYKDGRTVRGHKIAIDPVLKKAVGMDDKNQGQVIVTDDGDFILAYFNTDNNYKPIKTGNSYSIDEERTSRIKQDQLKLALGKTSAGVKQLNMEMRQPSSSNQSSSQQSSVPSYNKSDLLKGGWTESQIKQAVQAGKIKVN